MNFDFLKNLRGLEYVYEICSNAEKLAMTMPMQSVFTSRKSAEIFAKFIYMAAHNQRMEDISFAEVLSDPTVRKFINSRDVLDAFHFIRKSGNKAAHADSRETVDDAVAVLQDLHYVAGETACLLGLIDDYPIFEEQIESFPEARYVDEEDINRRAREMFFSYVEEFNAQQERDKYIGIKDYDWFTYSIQGNVEMHEYLEFKYMPKQKELIEYIQTYLGTMMRLSIERPLERAAELEIGYPVTFEAELSIDGVVYPSHKEEMFTNALIEELPKAKSIIIDCTCNGVLREFFNDSGDKSAVLCTLFNDAGDENSNVNFNMIRKDSVWTGAGMLDTLLGYKRRNAFTYKLAVFYPDSGECKYEKIINGREIDVLATATPDVLEKEFDGEWWSWNLTLWAEFDYKKHKDVLNRLRDIVRKRLPETELPFCEDVWKDDDCITLCSGIQWICKSLREVQEFLDELNKELLPIRDEVDAGGEGTWEIRKEFAVATWDWTDEGFKIIGTCM